MLLLLEPLLRNAHMAEADKVLSDADVEALLTPTLLAVLSLTWHAKADLYTRQGFLERAETVLVELLGKERAERLLKNRR
jgi:hypothetical protein